MEKFTVLTGIAAPLKMRNVDTDMIIPKQFLRTIKRTGLGKNLFNDMRYHEDGSEKTDFVLNRAPYRDAVILVAGENFGCGSSREHAPWALLDFGIRCVIAPSFADIFYNNSFKNGILPVVLEQSIVEDILQQIEKTGGENVTVDLEKRQVLYGEGKTAAFEVEEFRRTCLLQGLDDIGLTLKNEEDIQTYEQQIAAEKPWLAVS
ncbi:MAG: 3-isopropylmalate dehydratase small subunit [Micavibrio sp.]|nr:MAG: 3-isopropylmalate dehydratase small subunit [Micavibrio sp.]